MRKLYKIYVSGFKEYIYNLINITILYYEHVSGLKEAYSIYITIFNIRLIYLNEVVI